MSKKDKTKGKKHLLNKVIQMVGQRKIVKGYRDEVGLFAIELPLYICVAKSYVYRDIVSCHEDAVLIAQRKGKDLLMYIDDNDKFYAFNPKQIFWSGKFNKKGDTWMLNFKINEGEYVEKGELF